MTKATDKPAPNSMGKAKPDVIKAMWQSIPDPSTRTVSVALREAGYKCSKSTVARYSKMQFQPSRLQQLREIADQPKSPEVIAKEIIKVMNASTDETLNRLQKVLGQTDEELATNLRKLHMAAGYLLAEDMATHTALMMLAPEKAARLYEALGGAIPNPVKVLNTIPSDPTGNDGSGARVVDGRVIEPEVLSPSALAIREFRRKQGMAA